MSTPNRLDTKRLQKAVDVVTGLKKLISSEAKARGIPAGKVDYLPGNDPLAYISTDLSGATLYLARIICETVIDIDMSDGDRGAEVEGKNLVLVAQAVKKIANRTRKRMCPRDLMAKVWISDAMLNEGTYGYDGPGSRAEFMGIERRLQRRLKK